MDILKRSLAPIVPAAWDEIDEQAKAVLKSTLTGRKVVDVEGPKGWGYDSVSEGTLSLVEESPVEGVNFGIREVIPLMEIRVPFTLPMWDLDDISRGSKLVDFAPVQEAARKAALFEDTVIFQGIEDAGVLGLELEADNEAIEMELNDESILTALSKALRVLKNKNVEGPVALVCSEALWTKIQTSACGYPLKNKVEAIIGDKIIPSEQYDTAMLVSLRGGDSELIIGQDFSIGYQSHTNTEVNFYITETLTFRVNAPEAIVPFKII
ncbi:MAG: family 1 encapsulin nanocompartment shell protein [Synergistaceae bacterium]